MPPGSQEWTFPSMRKPELGAWDTQQTQLEPGRSFDAQVGSGSPPKLMKSTPLSGGGFRSSSFQNR